MGSHPSVITSHQNPIIKKARSLHQKKYRERQRAFLVEGPRALAELLQSSWEIDILFYAIDEAEGACSLTARDQTGVQVREVLRVASCQKEEGRRLMLLQPVASSVLASISDAEHHQGCVAIAKTQDANLDRWHPSEESLVLVLDGIADPGNAGTIIRSGDAFGAEAILLTEDCADPFSPKSVRATAGSLFHLPVLQTERQSILDRLRSEGFQLVGASPTGSVELLAWSPAARVALVLGHETHGISAALERELEVTVSIPMSGRTESLNVAAACAVLSWEVFRNRNNRPLTS